MASSSNGSIAHNFLVVVAAFNGDLTRLKRLVSELDHGDGLATTVANFEGCDRTALDAAAAGGQTHVCKYLIEELKLDINMKNKKGETPLHHATNGEHLATATYFLEKGANPNAADDDKLTALHIAAEKGFNKLLRLLISKGAEVDADGSLGTPLQRASAHGKEEAVKILLENNANPNRMFRQIFTPLKVSVLAKSLECVKLLLKAGADPNIHTWGMTALEAAAFEGQTEMIKCLVKAGANPNAVSDQGLTPIEVAALFGDPEDVMILFSVTSRIPKIPDWSPWGIIYYVRSDEAREQMKFKQKEYFSFSKSKGKDAFEKKAYLDAIYWYSEAMKLVPIDAAVLSNRSLCWASLNNGMRALSDAQACLSRRPDWPKAYYREGVAWNILKQYDRAAKSFRDGLKLDPENKELQTAFWEADQNEQIYMGLPRER